jgi:hypothetical protein
MASRHPPEDKNAYVTKAVFDQILEKTGGKAQKDAIGRRYFSFWTAEGRTVVYEETRKQDPS